MAEQLTRQGSRFQEVETYLATVVKIPADKAREYASGLCEEGYNSIELMDELTKEQLIKDFGFKAGFALKLEKSQIERRVGRFAGGGGGGGAVLSGGVSPVVAGGYSIETAQDRAMLSGGYSGGGSPSPSAEEGVPPPQLDDGSSIEVLGGDENILGRGASGIVHKVRAISTQPIPRQKISQEIFC